MQLADRKGLPEVQLQFVIIKRNGELLIDSAGDLVVLNSRELAEDWLLSGEQVELYREGEKEDWHSMRATVRRSLG